MYNKSGRDIMKIVYEEMPVRTNVQYFGPADVIYYDKKSATVLLKLNNYETETVARVSIPDCPELYPGNKVLAISNDSKDFYVIGLIDYTKPKEDKIVSEKGVYAVIKKSPDNEKIQICSDNGQLIFEYDTEKSVSRINIESGNLEFITKDGDINFISQGNISFKGRQSILLESLTGVRFSVKDIFGKVLSNLSLNFRKFNIDSPDINLTSARTKINSEEIKILSNKFSGISRQWNIVSDKIETSANDIISKTRNIFATVEELSQLKAGRVRNLIKSTLHIKAKNTYLKSEEDFKINGDKIHLG